MQTKERAAQAQARRALLHHAQLLIARVLVEAIKRFRHLQRRLLRLLQGGANGRVARLAATALQRLLDQPLLDPDTQAGGRFCSHRTITQSNITQSDG